MKSPPLTCRGYALAPNTFNAETRTVEATIATEAPVEVFDLGTFEPVREVLLMAGWRPSRQVPLQDTHDRHSIVSTLGSARSIRLNGDKLRAVLHFADTDEGNRAAALVRDGHVTDNSVGYRIHEATMIDRGKTGVVNGRRFSAPVDQALRVVTAWTVKEVSLVPIGADPSAKIRGDFSMKPKDKPVAGEGPAQPEAPTEQRTFDEGIAAERQRVQEIRNLAPDGVDPSIVQRCIDDGLSVEQAQAALLSALRHGNQATVGQPGIVVGEDLRRGSFIDRASDAICLRYGVRLYARDARGGPVFDETGRPVVRQPVGRALQLAGRSMVDLARECLTLAGVDQGTLGNREVIRRACELERSGSSTFSLPNLLGNVAAKSLLESYLEYETHWPKFARRRTHSNFQTQTRVRVHELDALRQVNPGGEYSYASVGENAETYTLAKYGFVFGVAWEQLVNDNLDAFLEIPRKEADAARRLEDALAFAVLTANDALSDGVALFHADHANTGTTALSTAGLDAAKLALRKQKGKYQGDTATGACLNLVPACLIVPAALEGTAERLLRSKLDPDAGDGSTANPWYQALDLAVHPLLDAIDLDDWFVAASPAWSGLEVCFLDSEPTPVIERDEDFERDVIRFKVRHVVAAAAVDWRGVYKMVVTA